MGERRSIRPLQRFRILSRQQGNLRTLFPELETFEKIADELSEAVAGEVGRDDGVDELARDRRGFIAHRIRFLGRRVVVFATETEQEIPETFGGVDGIGCVDPLFFREALHDHQQPVGNAASVWNVERDVEVSQRLY